MINNKKFFMKNKLYESLMTSISRVIKDTLNEASIMGYGNC